MHRCPVLLESPVNTCSKARLWTTGFHYCNGKCAHIAGKPAESYHSRNRARKFFMAALKTKIQLFLSFLGELELQCIVTINRDNVSSYIITFTNLLYFLFFEYFSKFGTLKMQFSFSI